MTHSKCPPHVTPYPNSLGPITTAVWALADWCLREGNVIVASVWALSDWDGGREAYRNWRVGAQLPGASGSNLECGHSADWAGEREAYCNRSVGAKHWDGGRLRA